MSAEITEYINKLERENNEAKILAAKIASEQHQFEFLINFAVERVRLEMLSIFGLYKMDN